MRKNHNERILATVVDMFILMRQEQGLSHQELAKRSGLTRPAISFIENGKRKPSMLVCLKLAQGLGVSMGKVLVEAERLVHQASGGAA